MLPNSRYFGLLRSSQFMNFTDLILNAFQRFSRLGNSLKGTDGGSDVITCSALKNLNFVSQKPKLMLNMKKISPLNVFLFFIISVVLIILCVLMDTRPSTHLQQEVSTRPNAQSGMLPASPAVRSSALSAVPATPTSFYRIIINNNLFRPLGWRPPRPREPYRLLGTILPKNADASPNAIIQTTAGNKTYIVSTGDKLDTDTTIIDIQAKQVILEKVGHQRTLKLNPISWLK